MFLRIISGKIKPGTWNESERTYCEVVVAAGAVDFRGMINHLPRVSSGGEEEAVPA